jgi:hypothetical protein
VEYKAVNLTVLLFRRSMLPPSAVYMVYTFHSPQDSSLYISYTSAHLQTGNSQNALKYKVTTTLSHTQNNFQVRHPCCVVENCKNKPYTVKQNSISDFIKVCFLHYFVQRHVLAVVMSHF